jgi:hypothetical protein
MNTRLRSCLLLAYLYPVALSVAVEIPDHLRQEASDLLIHLRSLQGAQSVDTESYLKNLASLGEKIDADLKGRLKSQDVVDEVHAVCLLAVNLPELQDKISELSGWYGRFEGQVSRERRGIRNDEVWKFQQKNFQMKRVLQVERLHPEHAAEKYRHPWEVWLIAPPSQERALMKGRMYQALSKIGHPQSIPLLVEAFRVETGRLDAEERRIDEGVAIMNVIRNIGGEKGLDALLECNRIAAANGFAGKGIDSIPSNVIRISSSL